MLTFKNGAPSINCINRISNTQIDDTHDIEVVMPMHNLLEYSEIYSKTSGSSWQSSRDELALNNNDFIFDFPGNDNKGNWLKFKPKTTRRTNNDEIMVPLRYLRYFWRTLQMPLINSEVSLMLT